MFLRIETKIYCRDKIKFAILAGVFPHAMGGGGGLLLHFYMNGNEIEVGAVSCVFGGGGETHDSTRVLCHIL